MSTTEEKASGHTSQEEPASQPRRTSASSSLKPSSLQHQLSSQSSRQARPDHEGQSSYRLERIGSSRTQNENESERSRQPSTQEERRAQANARNLQSQQTEKKQDDGFYVDNDYYNFNPWYDQEPKKPVFGLARPFPRTVRPGMLWGKKPQEKDTDSTEEGQQAESRPVTTLHIPLGEEEQYPPEVFQAEIGGLQYEVRRIPLQKGEDDVGRLSTGIEHEGALDSGKEEPPSQIRHRYTSGYSGGLPAVNENDYAQSFETSQTEKEKKEVRDQEEQELQDYYNKYRNPLARLRAKHPEALAEFLCTMIYIFFGIAGSLYAQIYPAATGDYQTKAWAWGLAVMVGIYIGGGVSGSHMSPWISITFSIFRGFPWKMCLVYCIAQILAGFAAGALAWAIFHEAILYADPELTPDKTGMAFYAIPPSYTSVTSAFFNNFVASAIYVCASFAIGDDSNTPPGSGMSAVVYGLLTYLLSITMGLYGLGISPARDLGPRFIAWWVGYGKDTFATGWWAYGPIIAGFSGTLVGALMYDVLIFAGGESPVNYSWPSPREIKWRIRARREEQKEESRKLDVSMA
ncbi:aquaporin-like protein [Byssothecium circinans]|uniref:Aquaporin-like protein n=1 Tax=Byssothecium circinans TaxID=147558 RepID=A0A6A5TX38_9PLEO|nr:aquaporin-like protein [Byssothecium circinans]